MHWGFLSPYDDPFPSPHPHATYVYMHAGSKARFEIFMQVCVCMCVCVCVCVCARVWAHIQKHKRTQYQTALEMEDDIPEDMASVFDEVLKRVYISSACIACVWTLTP